MKRGLLNVVIIIGLLLAFAGVVGASGPVHWTYEGEEGPAHWGELSHDFEACGVGMEQSPIDVDSSAPLNPADLAMNYQTTALNIENNGHTIEVVYDDNGSTLTVDGIDYKLLQFHFHSLSEHTVDGAHADAEMHLVHQSADGGYAVIGVLINAGAENAAYAPVWNNMPAEEGEPETVDGVSVNVADLLPADKTYYRYNGSFTTPPCTEGIKWFMMSNPVEISADQLAAFQAIYDFNYRPTQPFNAREYLVTSAMPTTLPETGGAAFPLDALLLGLGSLTAAAGVYLRRRS